MSKVLGNLEDLVGLKLPTVDTPKGYTVIDVNACLELVKNTLKNTASSKELLDQATVYFDGEDVYLPPGQYGLSIQIRYNESFVVTRAYLPFI